MQLVPHERADIEQVQSNIAGQLMQSSRRSYVTELKQLYTWLSEHDITLAEMTRAHVIQLRNELAERYKAKTAQRKFSQLRVILREAVAVGMLTRDPSANVRGIKNDESTKHKALTEAQLKQLLQAIDRGDVRGARDYALLLVLSLNGLRRAEICQLTRDDYQEMQGYKVLVVHGKGGKTRLAKLRDETWHAIDAYLNMRDDDYAPLFAELRARTIRKHGVVGQLSTEGIAHIVAQRAHAISIALLPHDLRATFATIADEKGAPLTLIQDAMGHTDPRTTDKYRKRRDQLRRNAVDYLNLDI